MNNDFFENLGEDEKINKTLRKENKREEKPLYIELAGNLGSGVTTCARGLSKNLNAYLFATDYYRNMLYEIKNGKQSEFFTNGKSRALYEYLYKKYKDVLDLNDTNAPTYIENAVKEEAKRKLKSLISARKDIVIDRHMKEGDLFNRVLPLGYMNIKIYVNSVSKDLNRERVSLKNLDYNKVYDGVVGMNVDYSSKYSSFDELYDKNMINSKYYNLFDYIIDNNENSLERFQYGIGVVSDHIKSKR